MLVDYYVRSVIFPIYAARKSPLLQLVDWREAAGWVSAIEFQDFVNLSCVREVVDNTIPPPKFSEFPGNEHHFPAYSRTIFPKNQNVEQTQKRFQGVQQSTQANRQANHCYWPHRRHRWGRHLASCTSRGKNIDWAPMEFWLHCQYIRVTTNILLSHRNCEGWELSQRYWHQHTSLIVSAWAKCYDLRLWTPNSKY